MFDYLNDKGLLFLMRASSFFKLTQAIDSDDSILEYKLKGEMKKLRILKIKLSDEDKTLNSTYQSNRNFILGQIFKQIIILLVKPRSRNKILQSILEKAIKIRSQVRPNRSCKRKNKHPRKKHHHNFKPCI